MPSQKRSCLGASMEQDDPVNFKTLAEEEMEDSQRSKRNVLT